MKVDNMIFDDLWRECLKCWRWIVKQLKKYPDANVVRLKAEWMKTHGYVNITHNCLFCESTLWWEPFEPNECERQDCWYCPAKFVDPTFNCEHADGYEWSLYPAEFYEKLKSLNEKRKH